MAREVLPIVGACVGGYYGRLPWWRKTLVRIGQRLIKWGNPPNINFYVGGRPVGQAVDPERIQAPSIDSTFYTDADGYTRFRPEAMARFSDPSENGFYRGAPEILTANPFEDRP